MENEKLYSQYMYSYPHKTAYRRLEDVVLSDWLPKLRGAKNSLYFHIPFCQYKCGYCNLFSVAGSTPEYMERYVDTVERQAVQLAGVIPADVEFSDLTLGGGTPLALSEKLLERIFKISEKYFAHPEGAEVVTETSPNQTTPEKLEILRAHRCSRISIGVQSFVEEELAALRRLHRPEAAEQALERIRRVGFPTLNIDIIYGIPGQTQESLRTSLARAMEYAPEEMFVYPLYIKPGTALHAAGVHERAGQEEAAVRRLYETAVDFLTERGYRQDSMRRFVREGGHGKPDGESNGKSGGECAGKYNGERADASCGFCNTISLGCGGRSYIDNLHFCTPYALGQNACLEKLSAYMDTKDFLQVENGYILSEDEMRRRYAIRHVLFGNGINRQEYRTHFGGEAEQHFPLLREWQESGYAVFSDTHIHLTKEGLALSDKLGPQLISDEVRRRMDVWQEGE